MTTRLIPIVCLALGGEPAAPAGTERPERPVATVARTATPPVIDGRLEDPVWARAPSLRPLGPGAEHRSARPGGARGGRRAQRVDGRAAAVRRGPPLYRGALLRPGAAEDPREPDGSRRRSQLGRSDPDRDRHLSRSPQR